MFGFLKNKLKEWVDKAKEKITPEEAVIEEKPDLKEKEPKEKRLKDKKQEKPKKNKEKKIIEDKTKEKEIEPRYETKEEPAIEEKETITEIIEEKPKEEKKGFLSRIFNKKEEPAIEEKETITEIIEEKPKEKASFISKIKSSFIYKIAEEDFNLIFEDLEMILLENNVALEVTENLKKELGQNLIGKEIKKDQLDQEIKKELNKALDKILIDPIDPLELIASKKEKPFVILFFGINGTGKTTSIAKLTDHFTRNNKKVVLAAADTFRAASIEQINEHAKKLNVPLIKHDYGSDPAAVGFDAIKYAKTHDIDIVLIDTAGRMHTKTNLLAEMEKIVRVTKPDLKLFVVESIAGNDATEQAKAFNDLIKVDGSILSKADIGEKGGTIISVSYITQKPIIYLGTGQNYSDIKLFNKKEFLEKLGL